MWGWRGIAIASLVVCSAAHSATLEMSLREKATETSVAFRGNKPKANDEIWESELRGVFRAKWRALDIKIEAAALSDRFNHRPHQDTDQLRGVVELLLPCGEWSCGVEWRPRYTYLPDFDEPLLRQNYGGAKFKRRWAGDFWGERIAFLATISGGYAESWPLVFRRISADGEVEATIKLDETWEILAAPKLEIATYTDFFGLERNEILSTLRVAPRAELGSGVSVSVEGVYQATNSTRANKDGEVWTLTPILRWTLQM